MMVNGRIINIMQGLIIMKMEKNILVVLRMVICMVTEFYIMIIIIKNMMVTGKMVKDMMEEIIIKMVKLVVFLKMVKFLQNLLIKVIVYVENPVKNPAYNCNKNMGNIKTIRMVFFL